MNLLKPFFLMLLCSQAMMVSAGGNADRPDSEAQFRQRLDPITSFSASFKQTVFADDGSEILKSSGEFQVARPGKIHWSSEAPYEQLIVADGETLWIYDPDLEQVTIRGFQKDLEKTPAVLFVGELDELSDSYRVSLDRSGRTETFHLVPQQSDSLYALVSLTFIDHLPQMMILEDTIGQRTEIVFDQQQLNADTNPAVFVFEPPPGVDILRED